MEDIFFQSFMRIGGAAYDASEILKNPVIFLILILVFVIAYAWETK